MNDEENNEFEQNQNTLEKKMIDEGKDAVRRQAKNAIGEGIKVAGNATKKGAKMAATKVAAVIAPYAMPIIAAIIAVLLIFTFLASIFLAVEDAIGEKTSNVDSNIKSAIHIKDDGSIVVDGKELLNNINTELDSLGLKKENLYLGNENQADAYLYKYMVASLSTQLPYIEGSTAKKIKDIGLHLNPITFVLAEYEKAQEVQGIVKIKRCTANSDSAKELKYLPYGKSSTEGNNQEESTQEENTTNATPESTQEENAKKTFSKLIEENSSEALNYFSIDENWMLCVAKYQERIVSGTSSEYTYTIDEVKIPYQTMIQNYSVPFSFFLRLQQMTQNPEYVSAVADMIMEDGNIEVTLYDTVETITNEYTCEYDLITRQWVEVPVATDNGSNSNENNEGTGTNDNEGENSGGGTNPSPTPGGFNHPTVTDRGSIKRIATSTSPVTDTVNGQASGGGTSGGSTGGTSTTPVTDAANAGTGGENSGGGTTGEGTTSNTTWVLQDFLEHKIETTTTTTVTNTITANVTKANVWVIEHTAEYQKDQPEPEYPLGEEGNKTGPTSENPPPDGEAGTWKENMYETTIEINQKTGWKKTSSDTKIEPNKFLGMWRNKFGIYTDFIKPDFDPNGKLVKYNLPKQSETEEPSGEVVEGETEIDEEEIAEKRKNGSSPAEVLLSGKDMFISLLENRENTQFHAQIMRELINYYEAKVRGKDYEINIDLSIFDTDEFDSTTNVSGSSASYGSISISDEDFEILCKITSAERGGGTQKQQEYVASVILNRVLCSSFPNSVHDVVFAPGQFQPMRNGAYDKAAPSEITKAAVRNVIENGDMTGGAVYFCTPKAASEDPWWSKLIYLFNDANPGDTSSHNFYTTEEAKNELQQYSNASNSSGNGGTVAQEAAAAHQYIVANGYRYSQAGISIPDGVINGKTIDCSSFVSWVLYRSGFTSEFAGHQKVSSDFAKNPWNWEVIPSISSAMAGDILVYSGHVEIYAGSTSGGKAQVYNCGGPDSVRLPAPISSGYSTNQIIKILRAPNK